MLLPGVGAARAGDGARLPAGGRRGAEEPPGGGDVLLARGRHVPAAGDARLGAPAAPPGPGLYQLAGDGLFDEIAAKVASETPSAEANDELTEADAESHWLDRRAGAGWGEWFGDHREDVADGFAADVASRRASASSNHAVA